VGIALLQKTDPELSDTLSSSLVGVGHPASPDLQRATALFSRIVDYTQGVA
jgi:hypothetical protein